MRIAKDEVVRFLQDRGQEQEARSARKLLADPVDTDAQGGLLAQLGICVLDLEAAFGPALLN